MTAKFKSQDMLVLYNEEGGITFQPVRKDSNMGEVLTPEQNSYLILKPEDILARCIDYQQSSSQMPVVSSEMEDGRLSPGLKSEATPQKKKGKIKTASFENFINSKIVLSTFDFEIGILAFYNQEGILAVVNLTTMVRRFLPMGLQGSVQKLVIVEKANHENNFYNMKKVLFQNLYLCNLRQILVENKNHHFDEFTFVADPNYSIIFVCDNDLIEVRNDASTNTLNFKNKLPFNDKIINVFYLRYSLQMYAICRDGTVMEIETESFTQKRLIKLYWSDVSTSFLMTENSKCQRLIVGHEKGIILSQIVDVDFTKQNTLERKFQIHDFHRLEILSIDSSEANQFVSLCKEMIVALWLVDSERPMKIAYFNNPFNQVIGFKSSVKQSLSPFMRQQSHIDRVLIVGSNRISETEMRSVPFFRIYNEDPLYEWDCFSYEMNKQTQQTKKSLQDAKHHENLRRFDLKHGTLGEMKLIKSEFDRRFDQRGVIDSVQTQETEIDLEGQELNDEDEQQASIKYTNSHQLQKHYFIPTLNAFMAGNAQDSIPSRLLDFEYHYLLKKNSLSSLSELEQNIIKFNLNIEFLYLRLLKGLSRDAILSQVKIPYERDKTNLQMQKIKQQNILINQQIGQQGLTQAYSQLNDKELKAKTMMVARMNLLRKNNPSTMMGLLSIPDMKSRKGINEQIHQENKEIPVISATCRIYDQQENDQTAIKSARISSQNFLNTKPKLNFEIKLPQITVAEYSQNFASLRDQISSREFHFSIIRKDPRPVSTRRHSQENTPKLQNQKSQGLDTYSFQDELLQIQRPFQTRKRTEHLLHPVVVSNPTQEKMSIKLQRLEIKNGAQIPKTLTKNRNALSQKQVQTQKEVKYQKLDKSISHSNSKLSIVNIITVPNNLQATHESFNVPLTEFSTDIPQLHIHKRSRFFQNSILNHEISKQTAEKSIQQSQSCSQLKPNKATDVSSQIRKKRNSTRFIQKEEEIKPQPIKVVDIKRFWQNYHSKLDHFKSARTASNHRDNPRQNELLRIDTRETKGLNQPVEEESKAQISTESNSKIINELSRESDEDTKIYNSRIKSRSGNKRAQKLIKDGLEFKGNILKLEGAKEREVDNVTYIENYFPFKFDPLEFLTFFDQNKIQGIFLDDDIETMPKEALKQILDAFISHKNQHELDYAAINREKIRQRHLIEEALKSQREEVRRLNQEYKEKAQEKENLKVFEVVFKKYQIEQQRYMDIDERREKQREKRNEVKLHEIDRRHINEDQQESPSKQNNVSKNKITPKHLKSFIQEQIISKWLLRKVMKKIDQLQKEKANRQGQKKPKNNKHENKFEKHQGKKELEDPQDDNAGNDYITNDNINHDKEPLLVMQQQVPEDSQYLIKDEQHTDINNREQEALIKEIFQSQEQNQSKIGKQDNPIQGQTQNKKVKIQEQKSKKNQKTPQVFTMTKSKERIKPINKNKNQSSIQKQIKQPPKKNLQSSNNNEVASQVQMDDINQVNQEDIEEEVLAQNHIQSYEQLSKFEKDNSVQLFEIKEIAQIQSSNSSSYPLAQKDVQIEVQSVTDSNTSQPENPKNYQSEKISIQDQSMPLNLLTSPTHYKSVQQENRLNLFNQESNTPQFDLIKPQKNQLDIKKEVTLQDANSLEKESQKGILSPLLMKQENEAQNLLQQSSSLSSRLERSLQNKFSRESSRSKTMSLKRESSMATKSDGDNGSQNSLARMIGKGIQGLISQRSGTANTGKKGSSQSSGGHVRPGSKSTTSHKSLVSPTVKRRQTIKGEGLLKTESDYHQQESIEEVKSEDSNMDDMRIEIDAQDLDTIKEKVFTLISDGLMELPPDQRLERIKIATILESLTPEQMSQMGLKFNLKRDNFDEIIDKIKDYQKSLSDTNQVIKIGKKTFMDIKKRLLPNSKMAAVDFISTLKRNQTKREFNHQRVSSQDQMKSILRKAMDIMKETDDDSSIEENEEELKAMILTQYQGMIGKAFNSDLDFRFTKDTLKDYKMKLTQQTNFGDKKKSKIEQEIEDYIAHQRLSTFKQHQEELFSSYLRQKRIESQRGFVKEAEPGSIDAIEGHTARDMAGGILLNVEGEVENEEKISLNALADEIMHLLLEVRRKNRKLELINQATNETLSELTTSSNGNGKGKEVTKGDNSSKIAVSQNKVIQKNAFFEGTEIGQNFSQKIRFQNNNQERVDDPMAIEDFNYQANEKKQHVLKRFKLDHDKKCQLLQLSAIERQERKYGIMVKGDANYLNPVLSRIYLERCYDQKTSNQQNLLQNMSFKKL